MNLTTIQMIDKSVKNWLTHVDVLIPQLIKAMTTETKENRYDLVTNIDKPTTK